MPNKLVLVAAGIPMLVLLGTSCSKEKKVEARTEPPKAPAVPVARVASADLTRNLVLAAEFHPFQEIEVHAKVAGYVKKMYVDVGDRVNQGQLLATLEIPEMADDLTRAAAARRRADAELVRAKDELQRSESSHYASHLSYNRLAAVIKSRPNLVAQQEIDDAMGRDRVTEAQVSASKAAVAAAEQAVQVAAADLEKVKTLSAYAQITAPFAGVVTKRYADNGAMIQAGTASQSQALPVVRLSENHLLRLVLPVPESAVPRIHLNDRVEVRVPTLNRSFAGKIARFSGQVQTSTRTMETEVDVPNPAFVLMPGMYAEAVLALDRRDDALSVPLSAVAGHETKPTVLVVNEHNVLEERPVKLGLETADRVEVLSGLAQGELVVVGGRSQYQAGEIVQPRVVELAEAKEDQQ